MLILLILQSAFGRKFSLSGFSSGAFMTHQMHIAYSSSIEGVGIVAGGPYMVTRFLTDVDYSKTISFIKAKALEGAIDDPNSLKTSAVWLFAGTEDSIVPHEMMERMRDLYTLLGVKTTSVFDLNAEHAWITDDVGNPCPVHKYPYINNCDLDAAGQILSSIYGNIQKTTQKPENLKLFDQRGFFKSDKANLAKYGLAYIPDKCRSQECKIHIMLHGCGMALHTIEYALYEILDSMSGLKEATSS